MNIYQHLHHVLEALRLQPVIHQYRKPTSISEVKLTSDSLQGGTQQEDSHWEVGSQQPVEEDNYAARVLVEDKLAAHMQVEGIRQ